MLNVWEPSDARPGGPALVKKKPPEDGRFSQKPGLFFRSRQNLPPTIRTTLQTHMMRSLHRPTLRTANQMKRPGKVVRTPAVAAGF
jgi:hypothetical protein